MGKNILPIILIILAVGTYFTFTSGKIDEIKQVQVVSDSYQLAITNAEKLIKTRDEVLKSRSRISAEDLAKLDKMIPDNIDNVRLIIDVNGIADQHHIKLKGVRTSATSPSTKTTAAGVAMKLNTVTISFSTATTYENFIAFMQDIERSLRIMDISKISLTAADNGVYSYDVDLKTYWLKK
ncbi:MAG: hypothetical protein JWO73_578 [Candidatus Taylorbacteria bacterium]|nr:hypothetical protein [Candidatus Taylorbacteria bacterium]